MFEITKQKTIPRIFPYFPPCCSHPCKANINYGQSKSNTYQNPAFADRTEGPIEKNTLFLYNKIGNNTEIQNKKKHVVEQFLYN